MPRLLAMAGALAKSPATLHLFLADVQTSPANVLFMLKDSFKRLQGHPPRDVSLETDNIIATGVGPSPCLISDEQWVRAAAAKLREQGVTVFMRDQLRQMRETLRGAGMTLPE